MINGNILLLYTHLFVIDLLQRLFSLKCPRQFKYKKPIALKVRFFSSSTQLQVLRSKDCLIELRVSHSISGAGKGQWRTWIWGREPKAWRSLSWRTQRRGEKVTNRKNVISPVDESLFVYISLIVLSKIYVLNILAIDGDYVKMKVLSELKRTTYNWTPVR